jgi:hypothetical protein
MNLYLKAYILYETVTDKAKHIAKAIVLNADKHHQSQGIKVLELYVYCWILFVAIWKMGRKDST